MADLTTEDLWRWAVSLALPADFYGQIVIEVKAGRVELVERRQTYRCPDAKPPPRFGQTAKALTEKPRPLGK